MNPVVIGLGLLALALVSLMRAPLPSRRFGGAALACAACLAAFVSTLAIVRFTHDRMGLGRVTDYDHFVAHARDLSTGSASRQVVLFVGSSISRNAIDDQALSADFAAAGSPYQAINLSLEGASYFERMSRIERYIRLTGHAPDIVMLEVNHAYDARPAYVFRVGKFSARAVEQFGPRYSAFTAQGIAAQACEGLKGCVLDAALLPFHTVMNLTNLGLANTAGAFASASPKPSFERIDFRKEEVSEADRVQGLTGQIGPETGQAFGWVATFRAYQRDRLHALGVRQVGYYSPPVIAPEERAYAAWLCATELSEFVCIVGEDPRLLSALNRDVWSDKEHLMNEGAEIFSHWFSQQVLEHISRGTFAPEGDESGQEQTRAAPADLALRPRHEVEPT